MNKSLMSTVQVENRTGLMNDLESSGWVIKNVEAYNADFFLNAELTARKRNSSCIMEINVSYEDSYVSITAASFKDGNAEYVTYFDGPEEIIQIVDKIVEFSENMTVPNSPLLAKILYKAFPDKVYSFDGDRKEILNMNTIDKILEKDT